MKRSILCLLAFFPLIAGYAQDVRLTKDSIPTVDGKVLFNVGFAFDLSKEELHKRAYSYLNNAMNPYSEKFLANDDDHTICRVTDYIGITNTFFQKFGMYITYDLQLKYKEGRCRITIRDISYAEKGYFEAGEKTGHKRRVPRYPAEDIMIHHKYALMTIKHASEKITEGSLERFNEIISGLNASFRKE